MKTYRKFEQPKMLTRRQKKFLRKNGVILPLRSVQRSPDFVPKV